MIRNCLLLHQRLRCLKQPQSVKAIITEVAREPSEEVLCHVTMTVQRRGGAGDIST